MILQGSGRSTPVFLEKQPTHRLSLSYFRKVGNLYRFVSSALQATMLAAYDTVSLGPGRGQAACEGLVQQGGIDRLAHHRAQP
jgi:hypothetical protein